MATGRSSTDKFFDWLAVVSYGTWMVIVGFAWLILFILWGWQAALLATIIMLGSMMASVKICSRYYLKNNGS